MSLAEIWWNILYQPKNLRGFLFTSTQFVRTWVPWACLLASASLLSCTEEEAAKSWGLPGRPQEESTVALPPPPLDFEVTPLSPRESRAGQVLTL